MSMKGIRSFWLVVGTVAFLLSAPAFAFTPVQISTITASASVAGGGLLGLNLPDGFLPPQALYGQDVVVPVEIIGSGPLPAGLQVEMVYRFTDAPACPTSLTTIQIPLQPEPNKANTVIGTAIIPLQSIRCMENNGSMTYSFYQVGNPNALQPIGAPATGLRMTLVDSLSFSVNQTQNCAVVPDCYLPSGKTTICFPLGSLSGPGTLVVAVVDPLDLPSGPSALQPVVAYGLTLNGATLLGEAQITLAYPANPDGALMGISGNPADLAPYWLSDSGNWLVMGPSNVDTLTHVVNFTTSHFSTFALFLSGVRSAADLRPMQRILTPNGDGINDTVTFSGVTVTDDVHIFDIRGRRVKTLHGPSPSWDGTDDSNRIVQSGVYIYQYTSQGTRVSGVIVVAK